MDACDSSTSNPTQCQLLHPDDEPWWIAKADFLRLEHTAEQVAKLLGITPAMVRDLERRGLLKLTKGTGSEVYTAAAVVDYLKQRAEARIDPTRDPS